MFEKLTFSTLYVLTLALCLVWSADARAEIPQAVGFWRLEANTTDSGTGHNTGTLQGTAAFVRDSEHGNCLELHGDGYVNIPSGVTELGDADFTIAAWIKTAKIGVPILSKCNGNGEWEENEKEFYVADSDTSEFENDGTPEYVGNACDWIRGEENVNDGKWHHVAVTWDSAEEKGLVYIDGVETTGEAGFSGEADNDDDTIRIGSGDGAHSSGDFIGRIDDVAIFDVTLTAGQIVELMGDEKKMTKPTVQENDKQITLDNEPNLVGFWKFDEVSGRTAVDSSEYSRNGLLKGGLSFDKHSVSGRVGKALRLGGDDHYVQITRYKGVAGTRARTVAAWIKTTNDDGEIISWGSDDYGQMWIFGFVRGSIGVTPNGGYLYMNDEVHDNEWHHVAAVVQDAELPNLHDDVKLYKDGAPAEIHDIGLLDLWPIETGSDLDVTIGREFEGLIDDVRIYDRALSDEQIKALFKLQSGRPLSLSR
jgi:hypothetical protein